MENKNVEESEENRQKRKEQEDVIELKRQLFKSDNKVAFDTAMNEMNSDYIVVNVGGRTTIFNTTRDNNNMMSVRDARDYFANKTYTYKYIGKNGDVIEEHPVFDDWFSSPHTKRYESLTFNPDEPYGELGKEWNTWGGWIYKPAEKDCSLYLEHIRENICNGDTEIYEYVLDFMAQMIQQPMKKIFHCLSIKGQKGSGKTLFVKMFMELFGSAAVEISDSDSLTNQFNSVLANRILVYGDEAFWSGDRKNRGKLKNIISSDTIRITYKMRDTIIMPNYLHFIFSTNEDWSAPVEKGERRWVSLRCGNGRVNDRVYFDKMINQMKSGGYEGLMKLLLERDISKRDWSNVPITEASKEDMQFSTSVDNVVAEYLDECIGGMDSGSVFNIYTGCKIPSFAFTSAVRDYASKSKAYPSITPMYVATKLKDVFGNDFKAIQKKAGGRNMRLYDFGSMDDIETAIEAYYNRN